MSTVMDLTDQTGFDAAIEVDLANAALLPNQLVLKCSKSEVQQLKTALRLKTLQLTKNHCAQQADPETACLS